MTKSFEQVLEQEKNELTEALILFGEGKRVNKALADLEMNRPEFYKFYKAGQQSRQKEIDDLHKRIKLAVGALESTPYWDRSGNCEIAIDILKKTSE